MESLFAILIIKVSYIIGSFPTAYLLTKKITGKDIRNEGTGNVGAANTYDVTQNKILSFAVFLIDFLKGVLPVVLANQLLGSKSYFLSLAAIFVVLGHNISVFLNFKGGRGLATALGATAVINPIMGILWCVVWVISSKLFKKNVHYANILSSILSPIMLFNTPEILINDMMIISVDNLTTIKFMFIMVNVVILLKHKDYFKEFIDEFKGSAN